MLLLRLSNGQTLMLVALWHCCGCCRKRPGFEAWRCNTIGIRCQVNLRQPLLQKDVPNTLMHANDMAQAHQQHGHGHGAMHQSMSMVVPPSAVRLCAAAHRDKMFGNTTVTTATLHRVNFAHPALRCNTALQCLLPICAAACCCGGTDANVTPCATREMRQTAPEQPAGPQAPSSQQHHPHCCTKSRT